MNNEIFPVNCSSSPDQSASYPVDDSQSCLAPLTEKKGVSKLSAEIQSAVPMAIGKSRIGTFDDPSDQALLKRVSKREENIDDAQAAFEVLYHRYADVLGRFMARFYSTDYGPLLGGAFQGAAQADVSHPIEEALQEIFLRLWRSAPSWRGESKVSTFLFQIAKNEGLSFLRSEIRKRQREAGGKKPLPGKVAEDPATCLERQERLEKLRSAVEQLPLEQKEALVLSRLEGLSLRDASEFTGTPLGTLKSRLASAVESLRKSMQK